MRAIATTSCAVAGRTVTADIARRKLTKKAPGGEPGARSRAFACCSAPVAEQAEQHQEQVDEVEVEGQRAHHGLAAGDGAVIHRAVHLLDLLRVPGGEPGEHDDADDRADPVEPDRL